MTKDQNIVVVASFILGVLVGIGGFWLWQHRAVTPVTDTTTDSLAAFNQLNDISGTASSTVDELEAPNTPTTVEDQTIRVETQAPGLAVVVAEVNLQTPAWVTVQDNNSGVVGNILGARLFDKGKESGIINLLRSTVAGKSYFIVLHTYSGVKRPFNPKIDGPIVGADNKPIMSQFSVANLTD